MKIRKNDDGSFDIALSEQESKGMLTVFIHALIETEELVFDPETKEYSASPELEKLLGKVVH